MIRKVPPPRPTTTQRALCRCPWPLLVDKRASNSHRGLTLPLLPGGPGFRPARTSSRKPIAARLQQGQCMHMPSVSSICLRRCLGVCGCRIRCRLYVQEMSETTATGLTSMQSDTSCQLVYSYNGLLDALRQPCHCISSVD